LLEAARHVGLRSAAIRSRHLTKGVHGSRLGGVRASRRKMSEQHHRPLRCPGASRSRVTVRAQKRSNDETHVREQRVRRFVTGLTGRPPSTGGSSAWALQRRQLAKPTRPRSVGFAPNVMRCACAIRRTSRADWSTCGFLRPLTLHARPSESSVRQDPLDAFDVVPRRQERRRVVTHGYRAVRAQTTL
jgi:hypothetical protein